MCITCSVLSRKLAASFSVFQCSFFQAKTVNHSEDYVNFQDIEHQFQESILYHFPDCKFLQNFHQI